MSGFKILLVEDHPMSRRILSAMLRRTYDVIEAESGKEALRMAAEHHPDLVLLDIEMPGMDGFDTLESLKESIIEPSVPVIFLTAREDSESRDKGLEAGAVDYLTKPYDKQELSIKMKNHLALYEARKRIEETNRQMAMEMEMASQLQRSLLPQSFPSVPGLAFSVAYKPSSKASGDFYDIIEIPGNKIGFAQVDVSGHGVRSAMIGAMFKMPFASFAKTITSPAELLCRINDDMCGVMPDSDFLTLFYGIIDTKELKLEYTNAAHPRPLLWRKSNGEIVELTEGGTIVGAFPGIEYEAGSEVLQKGDKLLLYTDGVTESRNRNDLEDLFGEQRLKDAFVKHSHLDPPVIVENLLADLEDFQGTDSFDDDVSLLLITVD